MNSQPTDLILVSPFPETARGINEGTIEPPLGIGYLAAVAEQNGFSCKVIDANVSRMKSDDILSTLIAAAPRFVGISVNIYTYQVSLKLADGIKAKLPQTIVILGGPTPSSTPLKVLGACKADAVAIGEGEETLREIIDNDRKKKPLFKDVTGVFYRDGGNVIQNEPREFIKNLDDIPFPAYHLFPDLNSYKTRSKRKPVAPFLTSRGCPYQCVFCSKDVFKSFCRKRSPENVIAEIEMLVTKFGVKQIDILDDNFSLDKERMEKILDMLIERDFDLFINLQSGVRTENLDQGIIDKMRAAKIWKLPIGVESGDPVVLKNIKKKLDLDKVLAVSRMARKSGMKVYGFFIIGLPGDNPESMQRTIDFAIKMDPDIANFCLCIPFPGTELHDMVKQSGRFLINMDDGIDAGFYANEAFYEMGETRAPDVLKYYKKEVRSFYFRPKKAISMAVDMCSAGEFKWFLDTGMSVIRNLWKK